MIHIGISFCLILIIFLPYSNSSSLPSISTNVMVYDIFYCVCVCLQVVSWIMCSRVSCCTAISGTSSCYGNADAGYWFPMLQREHYWWTKVLNWLLLLLLGLHVSMFRSRFRMNLSEKDAAKAIIEVVESACLNFRFVTCHL